MAIHSSEQKQTLFGRSKIFLVIVVILLLASALLVRIKDLTSDPVDIQSEQQVSFLLSVQGGKERDPLLPAINYGGDNTNLPLLQKADALLVSLFQISPLVASRLISIKGWLVAAVLLFFLLLKLSNADAAVIGMGMFLFLPFAIQFSRVVLPGAWVLTFLVAMFLCLHRWQNSGSWIAAVGFTLLGALAALLEAAGLYLALGVLLGVAVALRKQLSRKQILQLALAALTILLFRAAAIVILHPSAGVVSAYFGITGNLRSILSLKRLFRLELRMESIIGILGIAFCLFGVLLAQKGMKRSALVGLWCGFLIYCLVNLNAVNDSFYPLYPLILLAVLSFVPLVEVFIQQISSLQKPVLLLAAVSLILLGGIALGSLGGRKLVSASEVDTSPAVWMKLAERLGSNAVFLSDSQQITQSMEYYGKSTPLCLPGDRVCSQPVNEVAGQYKYLELYFLATQSSLEKDPLISRLSGFTLRCETGSGVVLIPLTENHPACTQPAK